MILHVGCGGSPLPPWLTGQEFRVDANPECAPDLVASMTELGDIGKFDVVYCSHALEHLTPDDALKALKEFKRCAADRGMVMVFVPDCEGVEETDEVLYVSPWGPITGRHMLNGLDKPYMHHHSRFTQACLSGLMEQVGFSTFMVRRLSSYNLIAVGIA